MTRLRPRLFPLCAAAALLTAATSARAVPSYPKKIESTLGLDYTPPCSICHENGQTGNGTPIEAFAWSLRARGLTSNRNSITTALTADQNDDVDSDGDGIPDIKELEDGTDVNSPANDCLIPSGTKITEGQCTPGVQPSPTLGCALAPRGSCEPLPPITLAFVAVVGLALRSRRRRRS